VRYFRQCFELIQLKGCGWPGLCGGAAVRLRLLRLGRSESRERRADRLSIFKMSFFPQNFYLNYVQPFLTISILFFGGTIYFFNQL
jgi:hypothetical protein